MARAVALLAGLAIVIGLCGYLAPRYLLYSEKPEKSDAVVLLIGSNYKARLREAQQLVREGYAEYLIIPAHNRVVKAGPGGSWIRLSSPPVPALPPRKTDDTIEDTHVEIVRAQHAMKNLGLKSAIFVSSPYHMRRIKIMAERVFGGAAEPPAPTLCFVPSRYESAHAETWFIRPYELRFVLTEYGKVLWFLVYSNFRDDSRP